MQAFFIGYSGLAEELQRANSGNEEAQQPFPLSCAERTHSRAGSSQPRPLVVPVGGANSPGSGKEAIEGRIHPPPAPPSPNTSEHCETSNA